MSRQRLDKLAADKRFTAAEGSPPLATGTQARSVRRVFRPSSRCGAYDRMLISRQLPAQQHVWAATDANNISSQFALTSIRNESRSFVAFICARLSLLLPE
jgi:hypothetical protein